MTHGHALKCALDILVCVSPHAPHVARLNVIPTARPGGAHCAGAKTATRRARVSRAIGVHGAAA